MKYSVASVELMGRALHELMEVSCYSVKTYSLIISFSGMIGLVLFSTVQFSLYYVLARLMFAVARRGHG